MTKPFQACYNMYKMSCNKTTRKNNTWYSSAIIHRTWSLYNPTGHYTKLLKWKLLIEYWTKLCYTEFRSSFLYPSRFNPSMSRCFAIQHEHNGYSDTTWARDESRFIFAWKSRLDPPRAGEFLGEICRSGGSCNWPGQSGQMSYIFTQSILAKTC